MKSSVSSLTYPEFLERRRQLGGDHGFAVDPDALHSALRDFQRTLVTWALRKGRAAIYSDCGTGKGVMALVWAANVHRQTGKPVLIVAPLAVTFQLAIEAEKFGVEAVVSRDGTLPAGITITNYDRLHLFGPAGLGGLVCDESSAIKSFDAKRRALVTEFARLLPYRLLCTATAAPNDYVELGTSSEALSYLGYQDMLTRFFVNEQRSNKPRRHWRGGEQWRFKGHAEEPFWRWVASWARAMRRPSDLGFSDEGFDLPPLSYRTHVVRAHRPRPGMLFELEAIGLREEREEIRHTLTERCERAAELLADAQPGIAWCNLNDESALLARLIDGAVEVTGSDHPDAKEEALIAFSRGEVRVLVSKASIAGHGMNWQHCHRIAYFPSHSYESWYQAIRRCWRYGQAHPVTVDVVTTAGGARTLANLERKAKQADRMFDALVLHMRDALSIRRGDEYDRAVKLPPWLAPAERTEVA